MFIFYLGKTLTEPESCVSYCQSVADPDVTQGRGGRIFKNEITFLFSNNIIIKKNIKKIA